MRCSRPGRGADQSLSPEILTGDQEPVLTTTKGMMWANEPDQLSNLCGNTIDLR